VHHHVEVALCEQGGRRQWTGHGQFAVVPVWQEEAGRLGELQLALGLVQVARLQANDTNPAELRGSPLTYTEAKAAVSAANTDFTVAGICGGVAAALGVVTFVLPGPPPAK